MCKTPMTFNNGWKYVCMHCNGNGFEEKLSAGCTGYRMRKPCTHCDGKGMVSK